MNITEIQAVFDRTTPVLVKRDSKLFNVLTIVLSVTVIAVVVNVVYSNLASRVKPRLDETQY